MAGVEISGDNVDAARANAVLNGVANARFEHGDVAALFGPLTADPVFVPATTAVVVDPPRKGCDRLFLDQLFAFGPRRVVYVSCDPATQARDASFFQEAGYDLREAQPVDLFPQTRHIECIATFDRRGAWLPLDEDEDEDEDAGGDGGVGGRDA